MEDRNLLKEEKMMGRISKNLLDTGDLFPRIDLQTLSGKTLSLPKDIGDGYGILLIYRGHW